MKKLHRILQNNFMKKLYFITIFLVISYAVVFGQNVPLDAESETPEKIIDELDASVSLKKYQAGIVAGSPTGLSGRWWLTEKRAVTAQIGIELIRIFQISHIWKFTHYPETISDLSNYFDYYYIGIGGMAKSGKGDRVGARIPIGLTKDFELFEYPLSTAIEIAPVYRLSPSFGFNLDASISLEYRF